MIEAFAVTTIHHYLKRESYEGKQDPPATPPVAAPAATPSPAAPAASETDKQVAQALRVIYKIIWLVFSVWTATVAYTCNSNSFLWGAMGFFMPVIYLVIHVAYGLQCDKKITNVVGGRRGVKGRK